MAVRACRICLITEVKMFSLKNEPLKTATESLISLQRDQHSTLPMYACYECAAVIQKGYRLIEKSKYAQSVLLSIYLDQGEVTEESLKNVTKTDDNLKSRLTVQEVSHTSCSETNSDNDDGDSKVGVFKDVPLSTFMPVPNVKYENDDSCDVDMAVDDEPLVDCVKSESYSLANKVFAEVPVNYSCNDEEEKKVRGRTVTRATKRKATTTPKTKAAKKPALKKEASPKPKKEPKPKKDTQPKKEAQPKKEPQPKKEAQPKPIKKKDDPNDPKKRRNRAPDKVFGLYFDIINLTYQEQLDAVERRKHSAAYKNAPYKCNICFKNFKKINPYNNHMAEHDASRGPLECAICMKRFFVRRELRRHIINSHEKLYKCKTCAVVCKARQAQTHVSKHEGLRTVYKCEQCTYVTFLKPTFQRHVSRRHGSRHECSCGRAFLTERGLAIHRKREHIPVEKDGKEDAFHCATCDLSFITENALQVHLSTGEKHRVANAKVSVCRKCGETFDTKRALGDHNIEKHSSDNSFPKNCNLCGEVLRCNRDCWLHIVRKHPSEKKAYRSLIQSHLCEVCGRGFKSVTDLRHHMLRHSGRPTLQCTLCPRQFYDNYQMKMHVNNVHSDDKSHRCPLCHLTFKVKGNMQRHMLIHTGERPHHCPICGKTFTQSGSRDLHLRTVHYNMPHPPRKRRSKHSAPAVPSVNIPQLYSDSEPL